MKNRRVSGQAMVEGSAFLVVFTSVAIGLVFLILGVGAAEFYHLKLQQVADTIAHQVVANTFWEGNQYNPIPTGLTAAQQGEVAQLLYDVGLPSANGAWSVTLKNDAAAGACIVTLTENGLPLPGGSFLPSAIPVTAVAAQPWNINSPPFSVELATSVGSVFIPAFRPTNGIFNVAQLQNPGSGIWGYDETKFASNGYYDGRGLGYWGVNYAGYGSYGNDGSDNGTKPKQPAMSTGDIKCAMAPWFGNCPNYARGENPATYPTQQMYTGQGRAVR